MGVCVGAVCVCLWEERERWNEDDWSWVDTFCLLKPSVRTLKQGEIEEKVFQPLVTLRAIWKIKNFVLTIPLLEVMH